MLLRSLLQALPWIGLLLAAAGGGWMVWAIRTSGLARLLGRPTRPPALILRGPYRFLRYPSCSGLLAVLLGLMLWQPGWATAGVFCAALVSGNVWIVLEDRRLLARFGEAYRRYRAAVPALIPFRLQHRGPKADR